jgi:hypothetical protein
MHGHVYGIEQQSRSSKCPLCTAFAEYKGFEQHICRRAAAIPRPHPFEGSFTFRLLCNGRSLTIEMKNGLGKVEFAYVLGINICKMSLRASNEMWT